MTRALTCREVTNLLADYLEGDLPKGVRGRFDSHLAGCSSCVSYAWSYQEGVRLARKASATDLATVAPAEALEALIRAILAARRGRT